MAFSDYSTTPGSNTSINGINIAENCSPANVNNALRQLAADGKTLNDVVDALGSGGDVQPLDATLTALAALVFAANKGLYATGVDAFSTYDLTAFGRTLAGLADYAALRAGLGAVTVTATSLANPGYRTLSDGTIEQWGTGTLGANSTGTITFPLSYTTWSHCIVSGAPTGTSSEGGAAGTGPSGLSSQAIANAAGASSFYAWRSIGV